MRKYKTKILKESKFDIELKNIFKRIIQASVSSSFITNIIVKALDDALIETEDDMSDPESYRTGIAELLSKLVKKW